MYGKLVGGVLELAPEEVIYNNTKYIPAPSNILEEMGYKVVEYTECPDAREFYHCEPSWQEQSNKILQVWSEVEDDNPTKVAIYKRKLQDSDYAVIKIAEGAAQPSEYAELIEQRREWRERINELEN